MTPGEKDILIDDGFRVIIAERPATCRAIRALVATRLFVAPEQYAPVIRPDHETAHAALARVIADSGLVHQFVRENREWVHAVAGPDVVVQRTPYLRIARPGRADDCIGYHRDIWYGASRAEWSFSIALSDTSGDGALSVLRGSHVATDEDFPFKDGKSTAAKGSRRHKLGFPYSPKVLADRARFANQMWPMPMMIGQALLFNVALLHGQEVNHSVATRWSVDVRFAPADSDVARSHTVDERYYVPLDDEPAVT